METTNGSVPEELCTIRIAVIDDDEDIVAVLGEVLKRAGYEPDLYSRSSDALLAATSQEYDLVISDLEMPEVSGSEILTSVKRVFPLTEVIMITGYASVKSAADAMHKGAHSYLSKPLTSTQIVAHVKKAIEKRLLALDNQRLIFELSNTNETLQNKVRELAHLNGLLKQTQKDLVKVERLAAIGEVVVSINHCVNNSISGIKAATRFIKSAGNINKEGVKALETIEDECGEIEAVLTRLKSLREATPTDYADGIRMIDLKEEEENVLTKS
jgi:two-component system response regulator PilR (NtrC family)